MRKLVLLLGSGAVLLTVLSLLTETVIQNSGLRRNRVIALVFVYRDDSVPSWYASLLLLACCVTLAVIAYDRWISGSDHRLGWAGLAAIFAYLSMDEAVSVHESFMLVGRIMLGAIGVGQDGPISRAWVVPAILVLLVVCAVYARFFLALPGGTKLLFALAFGVFFGGAVGMEIASDFFAYSLGGADNLTGAQSQIRTIAFPHVEELMEMTGSIIFLYTFLDYFIKNLGAPVYSFKINRR